MIGPTGTHRVFFGTAHCGRAPWRTVETKRDQQTTAVLSFAILESDLLNEYFRREHHNIDYNEHQFQGA